jgi:glycosyltransferase involved in cell wall biosynthesis
MKILLLHDYGTATGGAELQMLSLRQKLRERGHEVRLFSSTAMSLPSHRAAQDSSRPSTPPPLTELLADEHCFGTTSRLQVLSQTVNPSAYFQLKRVLQDFQPDVVHVRMFMWQLSPLILPLLRSVPCLYQTAVYKAICPLGTKILPDGSACRVPAGVACLRTGCLTPQSWAVLMVQHQLWRRWRQAFDLVVALSHGMKAELEAAGIHPVEVVHNGVPERPMRPPLTHPPTVVFAGRLVPEKGVQILLQAFSVAQSQVPQARLLIAGQGPEEGNLRALADQLGIGEQVTWLGHLPRSEMERQFDAAWVQAIPSLWAEPFGNVTTEAMMRGTAVIASAVGAQPEIVADGTTGFLVPPGAIDACTTALLTLLRDQTLAEQMGQAGRQRALTHFSEDRCTEGFLAIYRRLHNQYRSAEPGYSPQVPV